MPERGEVGERTLNKAVRMRSVRCDACGTKALVAASKCPKCGHGFEVRDGFGQLLPLAHCASCDSYYPQHLGSCRWCGTKPERSPIGPIGPYVWKGVGILVFASLAVGAWLAKNDTSSTTTPKPAPRTFVADTLPTNQPQAESFGRKIALHVDSASAAESTAVVAQADSNPPVNAVASVTDSAPPPSTPVVAAEPVSMQSAGTVAQPESTTVADNPPAEPRPPVIAPRATRAVRTPDRVVGKAPPPPRALARAPERTAPRAAVRTPARTIAKAPARVTPSAKAPVRSKTGGRWVTSVARNWAVVRADPSRQSRIIAAIGPNTRVQLGETRGAWRRIKAKGLAGWVEHRTLVARVSTPRKAGRLASR
jgi:hypothetical protein